MEAGIKLRLLRERFGLTGDQVARLAGLERSVIPNIEGGANKGTGSQFRKGLAKAFGLTRDEVDEYLDGALTLEEVAARVKILPESQVAAPVPAEPTSSVSSIENELRREMFKLVVEDRSFEPIDVDVATGVFRVTQQYASGEIDLIKTAHKLLESARDDRLSGGPGAAQSVMARRFYVTKSQQLDDEELDKKDAAAIEEAAAMLGKKSGLKESKIKPKRR